MRFSRECQGEPLKLQLGTATPGGGFQQFGQAFAEAVAEASDQVVLDPIATKGSAQNLELLLANEVKIAQVSGDGRSRRERLLLASRAARQRPLPVGRLSPRAPLHTSRASSDVSTFNQTDAQPVANSPIDHPVLLS